MSKNRRGGRGGAKGKGKGKGKEDEVADVTESIAEKLKLNPRTCTGFVTSHARSRDLKIEKFSLALHGFELVSDTTVELNYGRRYGLIGLNGCGKSSFLTVLGQREVEIPALFDIFHLDREIVASELTSLEAVIEDLGKKRAALEAEAEDLACSEAEGAAERMEYVFQQLDEMEAETAETRAAGILWGLGFDKAMQAKKTKEFSGGWRMRIALAKALFMRPTILLLDEPTNHLDLEACVWLESYLKKYPHILLLVSHSQDFLNAVCTNIILLRDKKLSYWTGNYDAYVKTREEKEVLQMKQYNWEQDQIAHMKDYIARFGHGAANLARQAKSKEKTLARMMEKGLTEAVVDDRTLTLRFNDPGSLAPPILQFANVTFGYSKDKILFRNLDFGIDLESRVALVGANGMGKSTLLKIMVGDLNPLDGMAKRHQHLRIGWFHQHLAEHLDLTMSPLEHMMKSFPQDTSGSETDPTLRRALGKFGITGSLQTSPMSILSDGMKSRVALAWLSYKSPHLLLLDEPTNHLDIETIDSLADAINNFEGGVVLVSHDFRLINQVAKEIWECKNGAVERWQGDIASYKEALRQSMGLN